MLVAGVLCFGLAVTRGEATLYLVLVFPVVTGSGPLMMAGVLLTFLGFFTTFLFWPGHPVGTSAHEAAAHAAEDSSGPAPTRRWGGVVFLGPVPIVFGSDPKMTRTMLFVGILLFVALLALTLFALLA